MTNTLDYENKYEKMFKKLFENYDETAIRNYIEENEDDADENLEELAFTEAVRTSNKDYIEKYVEYIELNNDEGFSPYLYETFDTEIQKLLVNCGAYRDWDDYCDEPYLYARETINHTILNFDADFQKEVYAKYLEKHNLSEENVLYCLCEDCIPGAIDKETLECYLCDEISNAMDSIGVFCADNCTIQFKNMFGEYENGLEDILSNLGWHRDFEGDSWKLETTGVYFIEQE